LRVLLVEDSENDAMLLLREIRRGRYEPLSQRAAYTPEEMERALREADEREKEALMNVRRHAEASHVRVRLRLEGEDACVEVSDDGRGFDTESPKNGIGRPSTQARALELGGELEIDSEPGRGTQARCRIPLACLVRG
jgi:signal transduction histidine kinase